MNRYVYTGEVRQIRGLNGLVYRARVVRPMSYDQALAQEQHRFIPMHAYDEHNAVGTRRVPPAEPHPEAFRGFKSAWY